MDDKYQEIIRRLGRNQVKLNEPLAKYTTFGIGGAADLFYRARSSPDLLKAVKMARQKEVPVLVLGGGSNILVNDSGYSGLVVKVENSRFKFIKEGSKYKVTVGAGMMLADLILKTQDMGLTGLEFLAGIPGTVGGAVRGNAGAWQEAIGDTVVKVRFMDQAGQIGWLKHDQCQFSYRNSRFKKKDELVIQVKLELKKGDRKKIVKKINDYREKRLGQPKLASAGCVFINPKIKPAGIMIDACGLKGKQIGHARISPLHANFIVNLGGAKAKDVLKLMNLAKKAVKEKFGVELKEEIDLVGFKE